MLRCVKVVVLMLLAGCNDKPEQISKVVRAGDAGSKLDPGQLGRDRAATLAALALPHHRIVGLIKGHRVSCRSTLTSRVPSSPNRRVQQALNMTVGADGQFSAKKDTDAQYGQEVVWTGRWLYPRLRYSTFVKRAPVDKNEPKRIADRMYGLLPAYIKLLGRFMSIKRLSSSRVAGRQAIAVKLGLSSKPKRLARGGPLARRWRDTVVVRKLQGQADLCAKTGVPLKVKLQASWDFHPPTGKTPRSGIPDQLDRKNVGRMTLELDQRLTDLGAKLSVEPPNEAEVDTNVRRVRLELERQMLTGERDVAGRVDLPDPSAVGNDAD